MKAATFPFDISINFAAASAVPPVATKSSIIKTESFSFIESLWTSIVAVPYSSSKSIEWTSAGNLFFFLNNIKGFFSIYDTAEAKTNPLDSIAAIFVKLYFLDLSTILLIVSAKAFSSLINVVISLNKMPFFG